MIVKDPFLALNYKKIEAITPKVNTKLLFAVWNLAIKFYYDQPILKFLHENQLSTDGGRRRRCKFV